jgi:hypothetical protein
VQYGRRKFRGHLRGEYDRATQRSFQKRLGNLLFAGVRSVLYVDRNVGIQKVRCAHTDPAWSRFVFPYATLCREKSPPEPRAPAVFSRIRLMRDHRLQRESDVHVHHRTGKQYYGSGPLRHRRIIAGRIHIHRRCRAIHQKRTLPTLQNHALTPLIRRQGL